MTEEQVKEEVLRYIEDSSYNYAILIDGEWGSGKTFFVTKTLSPEIEEQEAKNDKKRKIKYVSLYGCKTINDVQENIAWTFAENAREKIKNKANLSENVSTISNNILLSSKKIGNAILRKFISETSLYEIASDWLNLGAFIFIFDDLERCDCSLNEVFGFLNELVEHENTKVILIANEKEISGKLNQEYLELQYQLALSENINWPVPENNFLIQKPNNNKISLDEIRRRRSLLFPSKDINFEYKKVREKLIGVTLKYEPDINSIISEIISNSKYDEDIKSLLQLQSSFFISRMDYYKHYNLRTFQFFLSKVSYLLGKLSNVDYNTKYKENICNHIITETFIQAVRFKSNYRPNQENISWLSIEQDIKSKMIKNYVENGEFVFEVFQNDVLTIQDELKTSIPKDDPYYLLYQEYYLHPQLWCEEQLNQIITILSNNEYPISFYGKIILVVQKLIDIGFDDAYMKKIKDSMLKNIPKLETINMIDEDLWTIDDKILKEKVKVIIQEINTKISQYSDKVSHESVKEILKKEDWIDRLKKYTDQNTNNFLKDIPVFSKAKVHLWVENIETADVKTINDFIQWLDTIYSTNYKRESYIQDGDIIKEINRQLKLFDVTDLIKKNCIHWLCDQFDQIIRYNEHTLNKD